MPTPPGPQFFDARGHPFEIEIDDPAKHLLFGVVPCVRVQSGLFFFYKKSPGLAATGMGKFRQRFPPPLVFA
jgi:hypothetical protein